MDAAATPTPHALPLTGNDIVTRDLLELMGVSASMSEEEKQRLYNLAIETVNNRVLARLSDALPEAEANAWVNAHEAGDQAGASAILERNNFSLNDVFLQEFLIYKAEMAELGQRLKDTP